MFHIDVGCHCFPVGRGMVAAVDLALEGGFGNWILGGIRARFDGWPKRLGG